MAKWGQRLAYYSRNRDVLLKAGLMIFGLSLMGVFVLDWLGGPLWKRGLVSEESVLARVEAAREQGEDAETEAMLAGLREWATVSIKGDEADWQMRSSYIESLMEGLVEESELGGKQGELVGHYGRVLQPTPTIGGVDLGILLEKKWSDVEVASWTALQHAAALEEPEPYACELAGHILQRSGKSRQALAVYEKELGVRESEFARRGVVDLALLLEESEVIARVVDDPAYVAVMTPWQKIQVAILREDYEGLLWGTILEDWGSMQWSRIVLALFAGVIWFVIFSKFGEMPRDLGWYVVALVLGICSATATLYVVFIQSEIRGFKQNGEFVNDLMVMFAGIGLREELVKLLFFAPMLWFLKKRGSPLLALLCASFVGLGFAMQENVSYLMKSASDGWGRFLTANFCIWR